MNWDIVGSIGDFLGGIGVIVSLIYLATQIKSAERTIRFELRDRHLSDWRDRWFTRSMHPEKEVELTRIGQLTQDELEPRDLAVWSTSLMANFVEWQANYDLYREGVFTEEDFEVLVRTRVRHEFRNIPRISISWNRSRSMFPEYFVEFIDTEAAQALSSDPGT